MKRFSANQGKILINTSDNEIYVSDGRAGAVWRAVPWAAFVGSRVGAVIDQAVDLAFPATGTPSRRRLVWTGELPVYLVISGWRANLTNVGFQAGADEAGMSELVCL